MKRLKRTRKLFAFLRLHRDDIFDDAFQAELESMYRQTGAGAKPIVPALLCMALILQGYMGVSDAEAVELTVVDARWQMVLDCLGAEEPVFGQGTLQQFRERLIAADMDRRLLERTREVARATKAFDWKKLPKELNVGIDSRPLVGAGRVEDTFNLLGHAARKIVECVTKITPLTYEEICRRAKIPLLLHSSIKSGLDIDWNVLQQRDDALEKLVEQVASLQKWLDKEELQINGPISQYVEAVAQVREQDIEESDDGSPKLHRGVAKDRRISIEDDEMRHGRKSKSKRFNGYKEHIAADLTTGLILACAVTPANQPEELAVTPLQNDMNQQGVKISELFIDRAYINSDLVDDVENAGGDVICKPWSGKNSRKHLFGKADFKINIRDRTIRCPAGQTESFEQGQVVHFDPEECGSCSLRSSCTHSASGKGRTVTIAHDEKRQQRLRKLQATRKGREKIRQRTGIEHRLAHIAARKGPRARYSGVRKNNYDLRRAAAIQNLETIQRNLAA